MNLPGLGYRIKVIENGLEVSSSYFSRLHLDGQSVPIFSRLTTNLVKVTPTLLIKGRGAPEDPLL